MTTEAAIVWLDPEAQRLPYVRELKWTWASTRTRPPTKHFGLPGKIVAYSVLRADAQSYGRSFRRRLWWVRTAEHDMADPYSSTYMPAEGVHPSHVRIATHVARWDTRSQCYIEARS